MKNATFYKIFFCLLFCIAGNCILAQDPSILKRGTNTTQTNSTTQQKNGTDSVTSNVERRDYSDDSLKVGVYYLSTVRALSFDTSIRDFTSRFPIPATHIYLGNDGSATKSLLFSPPSTIGWDPGFHSLDVYRLKWQNARFFSTPKPYTELGYMLGTGQEQMIDILHTQNIKPYWNASFQFKLISAPGEFRNQKNNHSSYQLTSWYQSPNKRYNNYFILVNNKLKASESGGILSDQDYLNDVTYNRRFTIPTNIGGEPAVSLNAPFTTGHRESETVFFLRQQYDLGRKDSLVTDSTVVPLFYPRLRFEHNLRYGKYDYIFQDFTSSATSNIPDSTYYQDNYGINFHPGDSVYLEDRWKEFSNDFSAYQFPDANNLQQFIKAGVELQLLKGTLKGSDQSFYNIIAHGEYRNRTRNGKWDITATGRLYTAGFNSGDYQASISLQRLLSERLGTLQVGFDNFNRSPSFIYNQRSSFYLDVPKSFSKENTAHIYAAYFIPKLDLQLGGDYYLVSNYLYLNGYNKLQQENALFNFLRVSALKTFRISRYLNLHSEVYLQQKAGGAEVNVPTIYTRNRLAYEGRFFKVLNLSTGIEVRYNSPYKADNYSPVLGQFFYQDSITISNRPDVHAFLHLRIRTFKAFVRVENLNTVKFHEGFGFNVNSQPAPNYYTPGLFFRFGIYWTFVN